MNTLVVFSAFLAVAAAAPGLLSAPLLPKVSVGPTEVNVVKQRYVQNVPEYIHRDVPVPVPVVRHEVVQPVIQAAPVVSTYAAVAAPAISTYAAAPAISTYGAIAAPAISTYGAYGAYGGYGTYGAIAHPAISTYGAIKAW